MELTLSELQEMATRQQQQIEAQQQILVAKVTLSSFKTMVWVTLESILLFPVVQAQSQHVDTVSSLGSFTQALIVKVVTRDTEWSKVNGSIITGNVCTCFYLVECMHGPAMIVVKKAEGQRSLKFFLTELFFVFIYLALSAVMFDQEREFSC